MKQLFEPFIHRFLFITIVASYEVPTRHLVTGNGPAHDSSRQLVDVSTPVLLRRTALPYSKLWPGLFTFIWIDQYYCSNTGLQQFVVKHLGPKETTGNDPQIILRVSLSVNILLFLFGAFFIFFCTIYHWKRWLWTSTVITFILGLCGSLVAVIWLVLV